MGYANEEKIRAVGLQEDTLVSLIDENILADLGGEAVILSMTSGTYYGLDSVGLRIWSLLGQPKTLKQLKESLIEEYDVEPEKCDCELRIFLSKLADQSLIRLENGD
ncbi:MAG: PqqD family peptide modification chaperone [Desulforhabdus sp.]|nr:PqqD family peptide modification chaperone [Desulforhabdus sp.]